MTMTRRDWLLSAAGAIVTLRRAERSEAGNLAFAEFTPSDEGLRPTSPAFTIYKTPTCGCCKEWVKHLTANGFKPVVHDLDDLTEIKRSVGVPSQLASCHTAVVGRYVIEGHVPADLIKKLLSDAPKTIAGLSVPGMVAGSPGMETGDKADPYDVIAFTGDGKTSVYARR